MLPSRVVVNKYFESCEKVIEDTFSVEVRSATKVLDFLEYNFTIFENPGPLPCKATN